MTTTSPPTHSLPRSAAPAFTLTEVLIALALVAVLLIGITRIFEITSKTIGTGQALSKAVRTQKAIQQTISADVLGLLPTSANVRPYSGMMPANTAADRDDGMPFLAICNYRTPAYVNREAMSADSIAPTDALTDFVQRSAAIRGTDLDKNGIELTTTIGAANGETVPLFFYGDRNFRCDTICFFSRGSFHSQTGVSAVTNGTASSSLQGEVDSNEAFIWYGHASVFNSVAAQVDRSLGYGNPGDLLTASPPTGLLNSNNRFAEQFVLARMQMVLSEPTDHDARAGNWTPAASSTAAADYDDGGADRKIAEENTVVASNNPDKPALFLQRKWWDPQARHIIRTSSGGVARPLFSPFNTGDPVVMFQRDAGTATAGRNRTVYTSDRTAKVDANDVNYQALFGRTDIAGVGSKQARQRSRFLEQYDIDTPAPAAQDEWWENLYTSWNTRFWANPFVSTNAYNRNEPNVNAKSMAERQQIVATGVSQFIVEFAGDFVTQDQTNTANYGTVTAIIPDGVTDFVAVPTGSGNVFRRATRWYGLPRDVDGNGLIPATPATARTSVDVLPVHRIIPVSLFPVVTKQWLDFERTATTASPPPPSIAPVGGDYANNVAEPAGATDPDDTAYKCVWGARDFERIYTTAGANPRSYRGAYPQLIRFIIDVRDEAGKLSEPVTQQLVYQVPDELPAAAN